MFDSIGRKGEAEFDPCGPRYQRKLHAAAACALMIRDHLLPRGEAESVGTNLLSPDWHLISEANQLLKRNRVEQRDGGENNGTDRAHLLLRLHPITTPAPLRFHYPLRNAAAFGNARHATQLIPCLR